MTFYQVGLDTFEWTMPVSRISLPSSWEITITSPEIILPDSTWCLMMSISSTCEVYLRRKDRGLPKSIKYSIKSIIGTQVREVSSTHYFGRKYTNSKPLNINKSALVTGHCLTIRCYIDAGGGFATSSIREKNLPDCIQKEDLNYEEEEDYEEEVPKKVDWSSIERRDVALLSERMKELLIKSSDHDITICVQDKKFRAHRNILSVRSPVFAMMLGHDTKENNTSTINIEDCDPESFDEFLLYVYSGRTENVTPSNALHLYYSADKYDFPVLKERCVILLKTSLSDESICDVFLLAAKHQEEELLMAATEFFARNKKKILVTVAWQKFMVQNPVEANELILKSVNISYPENLTLFS